MFVELFQVVADDGGFLTNISEGDTKNRAHFGKEVAELIENEAEIIDWDLVLFMKNCIDVPKMLEDAVEIEFV